MLTKGPAKRVTIYLNEDARHHLTPLHDAVMAFLMEKGVAGATATRAYSGFGGHHTLHTPKIAVLAEHLPIRIEFVESADMVDEVLPTLHEMVTDGLIEVQDTTVVRMSAAPVERPAPPPPPERRAGPAKMLKVFLGEADKWHGEPLYEAIVKKLRMMEIAGATVDRGMLGYGVKGHEHKRSFWHPMRDLPVTVTVVDSPAKIAEAAAAIEAMLQDGLIVTADVDTVRLTCRTPSE